jgi:hypothetical protein
MKAERVFLSPFLLLPLALLLSDPQTSPPQAQTVKENGTPCCQVDQTAPREVDFPYYSLRDGFNSNLLLVGASPKPTDFVVAIRSRSGQAALSSSMTIQPGEKRSLDLRGLLIALGADVNGDYAEGSVAVYFNGTVMPLPGQLTVSNPVRRLSLESEMVDNSPGLGLLPSILNAVWWGLGGGRDATIMVSDSSSDSVTADVFLDFQGRRHESTPLVFSPHETKVLSIAQLLGDLKASPAQAPEGGITIRQRSPKPALIAQGRITDPVVGFPRASILWTRRCKRQAQSMPAECLSVFRAKTPPMLHWELSSRTSLSAT